MLSGYGCCTLPEQSRWLGVLPYFAPLPVISPAVLYQWSDEATQIIGGKQTRFFVRSLTESVAMTPHLVP